MFGSPDLQNVPKIAGTNTAANRISQNTFCAIPLDYRESCKWFSARPLRSSYSASLVKNVVA